MNKIERSQKKKKPTAFDSLSPRESFSCIYLTISGYLWAHVKGNSYICLWKTILGHFIPQFTVNIVSK